VTQDNVAVSPLSSRTLNQHDSLHRNAFTASSAERSLPLRPRRVARHVTLRAPATPPEKKSSPTPSTSSPSHVATSAAESPSDTLPLMQLAVDEPLATAAVSNSNRSSSGMVGGLAGYSSRGPPEVQQKAPQLLHPTQNKHAYHSSEGSDLLPCSCQLQRHLLQQKPQHQQQQQRQQLKQQKRQAVSKPVSVSRRRNREGTLPGGDLANACGVSPLMTDENAEVRVLAMLRDDQRRANPGSDLSLPEAELFNVPHTTLKRCVLRLRIPGVQEDVLAIGQSTKAKLARILCFMHAEQLLDVLASEDTSAKSGESPLFSSLPKPRPRFPPPLEEKKVVAATAVPRERDFASWDEYVNASERYVQDTAARAREEALAQQQVPPSGHPVAERAAEMVRRNRRQYFHPQALMDLNERLRGGSQLIRMAHLASKVFVATLPLDPKSGLSATGVAKNSKDARRECAAHALCILQLLQHDAKGRPQDALHVSVEEGKEAEPCSSQEKASNGKDEAEGDDADTQPGATLDAVLQNLQPSHEKLIRFYILLFGQAEMSPTTTFTRETATNGSLQYCCHLTMGDIVCTGKGVNRFEAQRSAMDDGITELLLYDERLQALQSFIDAHPSIAPESVPSAALPHGLVEQLRQRLQPVAQRQQLLARDASGTGMAAAGVEAGETGDGDNGSFNREEQAVLQFSKRAFAADPLYAARMQAALRTLRQHPTYLEKFHPCRSTLAIAAARLRLLDAVEQHRVTVVCGTTGCGKTTQVPQYILDNEIERGRGGSCNILVTQPRRLSSFSVADRIAHERLSTVGKDVGYAVRLDARPGRHITICTTGVLLQMFSTHPDLEHVSHLIIDEVHERDINCDVVLALVKELLRRNPRLRVVLMSATMQSNMFATYFGDDTPVIEVEGAVYPVSVRYLEDIATEAAATPFYSPNFDVVSLHQGEKAGAGESKKDQQPSRQSAVTSPQTLLRRPPKMDYNLIAYLVHRAVRVDLGGQTAGKSILVFLPGWKEIVAAKTAVEQYHGPFAVSSLELRFHIILLHSTVDSAKQRECFVPAPPGTVKLVLATNIAESGITIDDAAVVIDTGLIKTTTWARRPTRKGNSSTTTATPVPVFSTQLTLRYASQANGTQRKGRAGRTQGGVCYRLYTKDLWDALPAFPEADIHRVPLTQVVLKLLSLGYAHPKETLQTFLEPPSPTNVEASLRLLGDIGAVDESERLTPLGQYLAKLPCDPRIGKMIIMGAVLRCLDSVLTVAACADVSPYVTNREQTSAARKKRHLLSRNSQSDHISFLNAFNAYCASGEREGFARFNLLHSGNLGIISKYKAQYRDILLHAGLISEADMYGTAGGGGGEDDILLRDGVVVAAEEAGVEASSQHPTKMGLVSPPAAGGGASPPQPPPLVYTGKHCVDTSPLSCNSFDVALVKACVCAALFPNVAVLRPPPATGSSQKLQRQARKVELRTKHFTSIKPSKESACRHVGGPPKDVPNCAELLDELNTAANEGSRGLAVDGSASTSPAEPRQTVPALYYVFQDVFGVKETRQEFLTTLSSVSLWALLLFGVSESRTQYFEGLSLCVIDGWIAVHLDKATFLLLTELRQTLYTCLLGKYHHPLDEQNNAALQTVTELCQKVLKAPVLAIHATADEGSGESAAAQASQLVDTGSIIDPLTFVRRTAVGGAAAVAVEELEPGGDGEGSSLEASEPDDDDEYDEEEVVF
jgi:HrpA-like RNA helicase